MNNLHRELAPISDAAWAQIEEETSRTLKRYLAGRRVVDVRGPGGIGLSAVGTGHLRTIAAPGDGILARQREVKALVELRGPFELDPPAIAGAFVLTTRGGDFDLHIGQDVSIGYSSHTDAAVRLYLQETFTFLLLTTEAAVALAPPAKAQTT